MSADLLWGQFTPFTQVSYVTYVTYVRFPLLGFSLFSSVPVLRWTGVTVALSTTAVYLLALFVCLFAFVS